MVHGHSMITKEQILDRVSEIELFKFYCPNFESLDSFFKSSLRKEEKASCRVTDFGGYLLYKDFGSSDPGTNIWGYIMKKYGCTYADALDVVASDFNLKSSNLDRRSGIHVVVNSDSLDKGNYSRRTEIKIKVRPWMLTDKDYWYEKYGITKTLLEEYNIKSVSHFWINNNIFFAAKQSYCYNYYYHNGRLLRKIYQPLSKYKWYSNIDNTVVQGIANIPKYNDLLIISKSLKDVMVLKQLGYPAVSPNNEVSWLPEKVWEKFKTRYKKMFIFFDNDESGISNAKRYSLQYGVPYFYIPLDEGVKDISDYVDRHRSISKAKQLMRNLL